MSSGTYDRAAESLTGPLLRNRGIRLKVAAFPSQVLRRNNTDDLLNGTALYDVMSGGPQLADLYRYFVPLDDLVSTPAHEGLLPRLLQNCGFYEGRRVGLPYGPDVYGFHYRKDLFDRAGISWPSTWDELLRLLPQLKAIAREYGMTVLSYHGGQPEEALGLFLDKYEGSFADENGLLRLETESALAALAQCKTLLSVMSPRFLEMTYADSSADFLEGRALLLFTWPGFVVKALDDVRVSKVAGKWALAKAPSPGRPWLSVWQMHIPARCQVRQKALEFISAMVNPESDRKFFLDYGVMPSFASTYQDQRIREFYAHVFEAQEHNLSLASTPPLSGEVQDVLTFELNEYFQGRTTAREVVEHVNEKWEKNTALP